MRDEGGFPACRVSTACVLSGQVVLAQTAIAHYSACSWRFEDSTGPFGRAASSQSSVVFCNTGFGMETTDRTHIGRVNRAVLALALVLGLLLPVANDVWADDTRPPLPKGFVYTGQVIPDIRKEIRYFTTNNFVGQKIDGYLAPKCILTLKAAEALKKVQADLKPFGLGLKVFDCYRPQRAVDHFVRWAKDLEDTKMKNRFYPDVEKKNLFKEDYIAARSSHTRGSTVDLTIVAVAGKEAGQNIDMGTGFDLFSPKSWPTDLQMSGGQRAHRLLLRVLMTKHGFVPYPQEWWHFTLKDEPYPDTYFDFPVH
jgi:D-alanyl-D-alanine dipeptidase